MLNKLEVVYCVKVFSESISICSSALKKVADKNECHLYWQYLTRQWLAKHKNICLYLHSNCEVLPLSPLTGTQAIRIVVGRVGTCCTVSCSFTRHHLLASYHKTSVKRNTSNGLPYCVVIIKYLCSICSFVSLLLVAASATRRRVIGLNSLLKYVNNIKLSVLLTIFFSIWDILWGRWLHFCQ